MNYKVICDEKLMLDFIDSLPDTTADERYYFCLFGRKKYCKDIKQIKSDKSQLSRKLATKDLLFSKIEQMECPLDTYTQGDESIPQEALALYINPNPRSLHKATCQGLERLAKAISTKSVGFNPQAELMSCIQRCASRKPFVDFDIDYKEDWVFDYAANILPKDTYRILETRGGYHVLVEPAKIKEVDKKNNSWYRGMSERADIHGDCMIPMPGSYQGGFVPKFVEI